MSRTFKDQKDLSRRNMRDLGARTLLGYYSNDDYNQDAHDADSVRHALATYIREGGYVDFLLGRNRGSR